MQRVDDAKARDRRHFDALLIAQDDLIERRLQRQQVFVVGYDGVDQRRLHVKPGMGDRGDTLAEARDDRDAVLSDDMEGLGGDPANQRHADEPQDERADRHGVAFTAGGRGGRGERQIGHDIRSGAARGIDEDLAGRLQHLLHRVEIEPPRGQFGIGGVARFRRR